MGMQVADLFATLGLKANASEWKAGAKLIGGVKTALGAFAGYELVKGVGEMITSVIELGSKLQDTATKTGLSVEGLQFYGKVAKLNSSSIDEVSNASVKLARGLGEVKTGSEPAAEALNALHLNFQQVNKASPDQRLQMIANAFAKLGPQANKQAIAMNLFGRSGADLIPTLMDLGQNEEALRKEFGNPAITGKTAGELDDLGDNLDRVKMQLSGLKTQVVVALLPALKELIDGLLGWLKANKELIASGLKALVTALMIGFKALGVVINLVVEALAFLDEHSDIATAALTALGIVLGAITVEAAAAWAAALGPVTLVIAAITAVILFFRELWKAVFEGKGVIAAVAKFLVDKFKGAYDGVRSAFRAVADFVTGVASAIKGAFVAVFDWIAGKVSWAWDQVKKIGAWIEEHTVGYARDVINYFDTSSEPPTMRQSQAGPSNAPANSPVTYVENGDMNIEINAANADATEVGRIVEKKITEHDENNRRAAAAGTGGKDEP